MTTTYDVVEPVIRALKHPLRVGVLRMLDGADRMSPSELAVELGEPLGNVSYHVRQLDSLRLIKCVKRTPRRGAIEHYYRLTPAGEQALVMYAAIERLAEAANGRGA